MQIEKELSAPQKKMCNSVNCLIFDCAQTFHLFTKVMFIEAIPWHPFKMKVDNLPTNYVFTLRSIDNEEVIFDIN